MDNTTFWVRLRDTVAAYRPQLRFSVRMTAAGLLALLVAQSLALPLQGLWVVLTAVVVTQMSVGGSLRATIEYIVGTLGGAVYAAAVGLLIPHGTATAQAGVLALTIAPLAFAAAMNPNFRVAPFSAVLVLLLSGQLGESPIESALTRCLEVALGGAIAIAVSLLVFSVRAHNLGAEAAARILDQMARVLSDLLAGFIHQLDASENRRMQDDLGQSVTAFQEIAAEARRERLVALATEPDPASLSRTVLRLRHDLVMIGRAVMPFPDVIAQRLGTPLGRVGADASKFLRDSATALIQRSHPPALQPVEASLQDYDSAVTSLRNEGLTRALSSGEVERLFALGFALAQVHRNFADLSRCVEERAQGIATKSASPPPGV
ncbi:MAG TPA: FUSC family protein [Xanthobacteraceae bacterium]|nr:FUSC family protein [Xanthobacteraceae bacterium]